MNPNPSNEKPTQFASGGRDVNQIGGNSSNTTNFNFVFFLIGILALGGLAWGLNVGSVGSSKVEQSPAPAPSASSPSAP